MTKKLDKMLTKKKGRRRQPKERKMTKKERLAVRGINLSVGYKKAMELLAEHIKEQKRPVPAVILSSENPAAQFAIEMYQEIGQWDGHALSPLHLRRNKEAAGVHATRRDAGNHQGNIPRTV